MDVEQGVEALARLPQELQPVGVGLVAADLVLGARRVQVVHPVALRLVETGEAGGKGVAQRAADPEVEVEGVVGPVRGAEVGVGLLRGLHGLELDDAGRRVAAEQRALRAAQHLDPVEVKQRDALDHRVLEHDLVEEHRHRLRRVEVEVGVAEAANVEAREGAAEGRLENQARHAAGQDLDVRSADREDLEVRGAQHRHRQRHVLHVLLALLRGDDDLLHHNLPFLIDGRRLLRLSRLLLLRLLREHRGTDRHHDQHSKSDGQQTTER